MNSADGGYPCGACSSDVGSLVHEGPRKVYQFGALICLEQESVNMITMCLCMLLNSLVVHIKEILL